MLGWIWHSLTWNASTRIVVQHVTQQVVLTQTKILYGMVRAIDRILNWYWLNSSSHCGANVRRITVHNDGTSSEGYASGGDDDSEKSSNARKRKRSSNSYSDVETKVSDDLFQRKRRGQEELCQFRRFRLLSKKQRPLFEQRYLLGRPGQLTTTAKAAATRMRTIKSCWRCILRRIKVGLNIRRSFVCASNKI